jgi:hypothetical protein
MINSIVRMVIGDTVSLPFPLSLGAGTPLGSFFSDAFCSFSALSSQLSHTNSKTPTRCFLISHTPRPFASYFLTARTGCGDQTDLLPDKTAEVQTVASELIG